MGLGHRFLALHRSFIQLHMPHALGASGKSGQPESIWNIGVGCIARIFEEGDLQTGAATAFGDREARRVMVRVAAFKCRAYHDSRVDRVDEPMHSGARLLQRANESAVGKPQQVTAHNASNIHGPAEFVLARLIQTVISARRHPRRMYGHVGAHEQRQCATGKDVIVGVRKYKKDYP